MDKKHKAYLVDPVGELISLVDVEDYKDINDHLLCDIFTTAFRLDCGDVLYVDDMGMLNDAPNKGIFAIPKAYSNPLFGRGLLVGSTPDGGSKDPETELIDFAMMVKWLAIS